MMTSSNGNIFRVTSPLCGEFTGPGEFPTQRPVTRSFDDFVDLRLNERLSKQPWGWWFEILSWSLWRQCNDMPMGAICKLKICYTCLVVVLYAVLCSFDQITMGPDCICMYHLSCNSIHIILTLYKPQFTLRRYLTMKWCYRLPL